MKKKSRPKKIHKCPRTIRSTLKKLDPETEELQEVEKSKKVKRFHLKFTSEDINAGNRKADSNYFKRKISSKKIAYIHSLIKNIDQLVIVASFILPEIKTGLIDRFLVLAERFSVNPIIILTKADLVEEEDIEYFKNIYQSDQASGLNYQLIIVSNVTLAGLDKVKKCLTDRTTAIIGHSGVGKTTLLNHIEPNYQEPTQKISLFTKKGRHTTSQIKLHDLSFGGVVYDMPGLKEMDFVSLRKHELRNYYPEFHSHQINCEYKNCTHIHEPNCQVIAAFEQDIIHSERYQNYVNIFNDLEE